MIRVPRAVIEEIRSAGARSYPEECCGALLGRAAHGLKSVLLARPFDNRDASERRRRWLTVSGKNGKNGRRCVAVDNAISIMTYRS